MGTASLTFLRVGFGYESMSVDLFEEINIHFPTGWTGIIGANGSGKSTLLKLATGELKADTGTIQIPGNTEYCRQRTDNSPRALLSLIKAEDGEASLIKGQLGIKPGWIDRWESLSHGERKRAQIGVSLWKKPFILGLDEPTNHVDSEARSIIFDALVRFRGIGLLVSHDRELLDALCDRLLFVKPPGVTMRTGDIAEGLEQEKREAELAQRQYEQISQKLQQVKKVAAGHRRDASRAHQKRSKKGISSKDHDAKSKKDLARMSGKDGQSGRLLKQQAGKIRQLQNKLDRFSIEKAYEMGVWQPGTLSKKNSLFNQESYRLPLGKTRFLNLPPLTIRPTDRIGLSGPNGTGKSTLIRHILDETAVAQDNLIYMPQEMEAAESGKVIQAVRDLPGDKLGLLMSIVNRLGTRPQRLLETDTPSPGEIRKTLLALGIVRVPHLIIMDEPTNHLDLPSIECLEEMLAACPCALLLVSHDKTFLNRLTRTHWQIIPDAGNSDLFFLQTD